MTCDIYFYLCLCLCTHAVAVSLFMHAGMQLMQHAAAACSSTTCMCMSCMLSMHYVSTRTRVGHVLLRDNDRETHISPTISSRCDSAGARKLELCAYWDVCRPERALAAGTCSSNRTEPDMLSCTGELISPPTICCAELGRRGALGAALSCDVRTGFETWPAT